MIKLSKLADYGIVLLSYFARGEDGQIHTSRELAEASGLPLPTVGKVLKSLSRGELLVSHRGVKGGYSLARPVKEISITDMVYAVDGPIALTDCSTTAPHECDLGEKCNVRANWRIINDTVVAALNKLTLSDLIGPNEADDNATNNSHLKIV